jgi:DNA-binding CsgD family transcriptional regulator
LTVPDTDPDLTAAWWPFCRIAPGLPRAHEPVQAKPALGSPLEALSAVLLDLYPLALGTAISAFEPGVFELLQQGIAFDSGWMGRATLRQGAAVMHNSCLYRLPLECALDWERLKHDDPTVVYRSEGIGRPLMISTADASLSPAFRAYVQKYSLEHALMCWADDPVLGLHSFLSLYRSDRQRPFSQGDVGFLEALMPHVASATNINRIHQIAQIKAGTGGSRIAVALCDGFGFLQFAESGFADFMLLQWPDWKGPSLPAEISLDPSGQGKAGFVGTRITVEVRHLAELVVVQVRKRSVAASLTPRERDVTRLFAGGLTYKEVARRLELAPSTVKHHLRNAYSKLGVQDKGKIASLLSLDGESEPSLSGSEM